MPRTRGLLLSVEEALRSLFAGDQGLGSGSLIPAFISESGKNA